MRQGFYKKHRNTSYLVATVFSLFLHLFLLATRFFNSDLTKPEAVSERVIELAELPPTLPQTEAQVPPANPKSQIVETEDAGNREIDPNATMLSDKNQKAEQQTRASRTDDFRNGKGSGSKVEQQEDSLGENPSDLEVSEPKKTWKNLSLKDLSISGTGGEPSASDDYLPGVASGERTILSTREFRYFSYYNRIKELLRQHWKPSVEREVAKLWGKGRMLRENELITRVLVLLDKNGQLQKVSKVGHSGVSEIDDMAVQAFEKAAPFPNPPTGLVDPDGFVRINWDFILQTAAAPSIQFRPGGRAAFR